MPFIPVEHTVRAEIRMSLFGQQIENTLWFKFEQPNGPSEMAALGVDLLAWWNAHYKLACSQELELREIYLQDQTQANSIVHTQPAPTPHPTGVSETQSLPASVCLCVSFRTGQSGRSFRGRNYISGIPVNQYDDNKVLAPTVNAIVNAYQALPGSLDQSGATWVIASKYSNNAPRSVGVTTPVQTALATNDDIDSQRRRLNGRGK